MVRSELLRVSGLKAGELDAQLAPLKENGLIGEIVEPSSRKLQSVYKISREGEDSESEKVQ